MFRRIKPFLYVFVRRIIHTKLQLQEIKDLVQGKSSKTVTYWAVTMQAVSSMHFIPAKFLRQFCSHIFLETGGLKSFGFSVMVVFYIHSLDIN